MSLLLVSLLLAREFMADKAVFFFFFFKKKVVNLWGSLYAKDFGGYFLLYLSAGWHPHLFITCAPNGCSMKRWIWASFSFA